MARQSLREGNHPQRQVVPFRKEGGYSTSEIREKEFRGGEESARTETFEVEEKAEEVSPIVSSQESVRCIVRERKFNTQCLDENSSLCYLHNGDKLLFSTVLR